MLVMVVFFIAFRWIHLSTPLIRMFLLVLILLLIPTLNFLPVWFALSLLRLWLPSRMPMIFILWMVAMIFFFQAEDGMRVLTVTGVQTCALPIWRDRLGKRARHRVAVRAHVADLAQREPQARRGREAQREEEHPGKSVDHAMRE